MRVLIVCPDTSNKGGLVKVAERQYEILNASSDSAFYYFTSKRGNGIFGQVLQLLLFPFHLLTNRYDAVHIHTASGRSYFRKLMYAFFSNLAANRYILHIHGGGFQSFISTFWFAKLTFRALLHQKKCFAICLTEELCAYITLNFNCENHPVVVRNPGRSNLITEKYPAKNNNSNNKLIFVGRLCEEKGVLKLVAAIHELKQKGLIYKVDIYGDGSIRDEVSLLIASLGLSKAVVLKGWVDDTVIRYDQYDFNILPSEIEAMPLSVIEAMQQGVPSIVTNVGAIDEMLTNKHDSIILPDNSISSIVEGISASVYLSPEVTRKNLLLNYNENFSSESFYQCCHELYSQGAIDV